MKFWITCHCKPVKSSASTIPWCPDCHGAGGLWIEETGLAAKAGADVAQTGFQLGLRAVTGPHP